MLGAWVTSTQAQRRATTNDRTGSRGGRRNSRVMEAVYNEDHGEQVTTQPHITESLIPAVTPD